MRRRIQTELARRDKGKTVFGDKPTGYGSFGVKGGKSKNTLIYNSKLERPLDKTTNKSANKGTQGDYIYFKNIMPFQQKIVAKPE